MPKQSIAQQDSLDIKMQEHQKTKANIPMSKPPTPLSTKSSSQEDPNQSQPQGNSKPSIKVYQQRNNMIIGDNSYNYW